jgi:hypothetical protein
MRGGGRGKARKLGSGPDLLEKDEVGLVLVQKGWEAGQVRKLETIKRED